MKFQIRNGDSLKSRELILPTIQHPNVSKRCAYTYTPSRSPRSNSAYTLKFVEQNRSCEPSSTPINVSTVMIVPSEKIPTRRTPVAAPRRLERGHLSFAHRLYPLACERALCACTVRVGQVSFETFNTSFLIERRPSIAR